jgi:hypothetical protein
MLGGAPRRMSTQQGAYIGMAALTGCAAGDMLANALHELIKSIGPGMDRCWFDSAMLWGRHDPFDGSPSIAIMLPFSYNCNTRRTIRADIRAVNNIFRDRWAR